MQQPAAACSTSQEAWATWRRSAPRAGGGVQAPGGSTYVGAALAGGAGGGRCLPPGAAQRLGKDAVGAGRTAVAAAGRGRLRCATRAHRTQDAMQRSRYLASARPQLRSAQQPGFGARGRAHPPTPPRPARGRSTGFTTIPTKPTRRAPSLLHRARPRRGRPSDPSQRQHAPACAHGRGLPLSRIMHDSRKKRA